jgi:hypothetical protein
MHDLRYARPMLLLHAWETFYVIVGSSAAALTGLQFVVIALNKETRLPSDTGAVSAFATPNVVHFCAVLTVASLITMPGHTALSLSICLAVLGAAGVAYSLNTARLARRQTGYEPVLEDWLFHVGFPILSYAALFITGTAAYSHITGSLYVVAAASLALLFIGIHNAWDSAVYISTRGDGQ